MNYEDSTILSAVKKAIEATVNEFHKTPFDFLSERDIQALLYSKIRKEIGDILCSFPNDEHHKQFGFKDPFKVHPVTTEYFYKCINARFDVAILSSIRDEKESIFRQPCRIGVEIKLWQAGYRFEPDYLADVAKLQNYREYLQEEFKEERRAFTGIAMLFVHPNIPEDLVQKHLSSRDESSKVDYPKDGIALHWVTKDAHWWEQPPLTS